MQNVVGPKVAVAAGSLPPNGGGDRELEMEMAYPDPSHEISVYVSQDPERYYLDNNTLKKLRTVLGDEKATDMGLPIPKESSKEYGNQNYFVLHEISLNTLRLLSKEFDIRFVLLQNVDKTRNYGQTDDINQLLGVQDIYGNNGNDYKGYLDDNNKFEPGDFPNNRK